jgi:ketosteroid isomerase-like protein
VRRTRIATLALALMLTAVPGFADDFAPGSAGALTKAFNASDAAAIAAMYTEEAWLLPPNDDFQVGRAAIQVAWEGLISLGLGLELEAKEALASGDLAYKVGTYKLMTPDGTVADHGKYIEVWTRVDGNWLIHRDTFNSSVPLPVESVPLPVEGE